jgi:iron complex outermembrane recepter protein
MRRYFACGTTASVLLFAINSSAQPASDSPARDSKAATDQQEPARTPPAEPEQDATPSPPPPAPVATDAPADTASQAPLPSQPPPVAPAGPATTVPVNLEPAQPAVTAPSNQNKEDGTIEVTVTADRQSRPQSQVTQSVRVLNEADIAVRPVNQRNAAEILRYEPGVFVSPLSRNDANWGSYGGLGPKYNTYLLDGLPIDAFVDGMSLDPWAFQRVESQRGPASVMYSNYLSADFAGQQSPLAGTTNFILRRHIDEERTKLAVGVGSYRALEGRAYHQGNARNLHYFLGASTERSNYTNYGASPSWLNIQHDPKYTKTKVYGNVAYELGRQDHYVSLFGHHTSHEGFAGRYNRDFDNSYDTVNLIYFNRINRIVDARASVGLRRYDRRWGEDNFGQVDAAGNPVPNQLALREHDGVRQQIVPSDMTFNIRHWGDSTLTLGGDAQYAKYRTIAEANGIRTTQNDATSSSLGAFAEEKVVLGQWVLRAGGRVAHLQNHYDLLSGAEPGITSKSWNKPLWSTGVRYNLMRELGLFANAGSSFVPPAAKSVGGTLSAADRGVAGRNGQLPSPSLKPESGLGADIGLDLRPWKRTTLGLRGFLNQASDAIVDIRVSDDPSQSQSINAGKARTVGLEASAQQRFFERSSAFVNATIVRSRISDSPDAGQNGAQVPFVPNVIANLGFVVDLPGRLQVAGFVNGVGTFYDSTSKADRKEFGPFIIPNARIQETLPMNAFDVDFILALNNLINKKYDLPWQFRDPGFNGMATVQVTTK